MKIEVTIETRKLIIGLLIIVLFFVIMHFALFGINRNQALRNHIPGTETLGQFFNLDKESNLPSWFASSLLLLAAMLLALIAFGKKHQNDPYVRQWTGLPVIFAFLSADEAASLHESTIDPLQNALNTSGVLTFAWVIPGFIFAVFCLLVYLPLLKDLPTQTRILFVIAGSLFGLGALGIELIGGYLWQEGQSQTLKYAIVVAVEETLEMIGIVLFIYALICYSERSTEKI